MDDPGTSGTWEEMLASHLREKQAGPLVCPVCTQNQQLRPERNYRGADGRRGRPPRVPVRIRSERQLRVLDLLRRQRDRALVRTLGRRTHSSYDRRGKPTGITRKAAEDAARRGGTVDFEGRHARVVRLNVKSSIGAPHSVVLVLDLGDEHLASAAAVSL